MIEAVNLTKHFGPVVAVDKVSFTLDAGQTMVLIGTSGCGKTTTLRMINRLIAPTDGYVLLDGENIMERDPVKMRRQMGYVIQNVGLFPHYTVAENIAVVPKLLNQDPKETRSRVEQLLDRLGLPAHKYAQKYPAQLSGGQQQRVGLARALAANPPIVLMDEPFGALDPITRRELQEDFKNLDELTNKTIIMVTHDLFEAFAMGDLICVLDKGKVQQIGTPRELLFKPANEFVREFLSGKLVQLELHSIRLRDLFEHLPRKTWPENVDIIQIDPDNTIMSVFAELVSHPHGKYVGAVTVDDSTRKFDLQTLMDQFHARINAQSL